MKAVRRSRTSLFNDVLRNFLFKEIFKGCCLLFSYQGSCRSLLSDSLYMLPQRFAFVKNFFSSFCFLFSQLSATACLGYHISTALSTSFLTVSLRLPDPLLPLSGLRLFRLRVSGRPDFLRLFRPCHQRQVLSYHHRKELSTFFLFFIYFRQFV